ncbi:hypothetical protein ACFWIB_15350 [Streptomyces sp. NPDC127051]|uniref:hypothetical protein n=1 Tax=Streptomyces sp. NPDC127051 TaxID=3347119 RepID=UPI0036475EFA
MTNALPPQIEAILAAHEKAEHGRQRNDGATKTTVRFLHEHRGEETTLHTFYSPSEFPIPMPAAGQTVRVLTEDPLLVERVEFTYEVAIDGVQYVTGNVYVQAPGS